MCLISPQRHQRELLAWSLPPLVLHLRSQQQWKLYKWTESVCFHHSFYIRTLHLLHVSSPLYDVVEGLPALYIGPLCEGLEGSCSCLQRLVSSPLPTFPIYTPLNGTKRLSHLRKWSTVSNAHKQSIPLKFLST